MERCGLYDSYLKNCAGLQNNCKWKGWLYVHILSNVDGTLEQVAKLFGSYAVVHRLEPCSLSMVMDSVFCWILRHARFPRI